MVLCFRSQVLHMIEAHSSIAGCGCTEVLEICLCIFVQGREIFIQADYVWNLLHNLHADGRAKKLSFRLF